MVPEDVYCFLDCIYFVVIWWDELVCHVVVGDDFLELCRAFIVEHVWCWMDASVLQPTHYALVSFHHFT